MAAFRNEDQKDGLKGIFGVLRVAQPTAADAEDHGAMVRQDFLEGGLVAVREKSLEQLALAEAGKGSDAEEGAQVTEERGWLHRGHQMRLLNRIVLYCMSGSRGLEFF